MRRAAAWGAVAVSVFAFAACGGTGEDSGSTSVLDAQAHVLQDAANDVHGRAAPDLTTTTVHQSGNRLVVTVHVGGELTHALKEPCCFGRPTYIGKGLAVYFFDEASGKEWIGAGGTTFDLKRYERWKNNRPDVNHASSVRINPAWNVATFVFPVSKVPISDHRVRLRVNSSAGTTHEIGHDNAPDEGFSAVSLP